MTDKLIELAERAEQATGPDSAMDFDIARTIADLSGSNQPILAYTASLDAAMTLVPEGWFWTGGRDREGRGAMAVVSQDDCLVPAVAATPALALCAAALRARAS